MLGAQKLGADIMTAPPSAIGLIKHLLTEKGIEVYLSDWEMSGQTRRG